VPVLVKVFVVSVDVETPDMFVMLRVLAPSRFFNKLMLALLEVKLSVETVDAE
jgi:hypothetical protein